ncbi:restriction endonuclease subunit S [Methanococcus sp. CF]
MENEFKDTEIGKIPVDWEVLELQNVSEVIDSLHKTPKYCEIGYPMVRVTDISQGYLNLKNALKVSNEVFEEFNKKYTPQKGDIVFSRVGSYGISSYVNTDEKFCLGQNTVVIIPKFSKKYLYYALNSNIIKTQIECAVTGSTQKTISLKDIRALKIPIPPLSEQQKIAQILSSLDDKIENNSQQNKILEETANSIFKEWFVNFNFLDEDGKPYFENGGEMEFNKELGSKIPKGWKFNELKEFGKIVCGKTPSKSVSEYFCGETPFIKIPDMHNKMFLVKTEDSLTEKGVNSQKNKLIPANSICVSCIATVGLVSITVTESQTNQQINSIIPKNDNLTIYLYFTLKSMIDYIKILAGGGSATLNLNTTEFSKIKIIMPEKDILEKYHKKMEPLKNKILSNEIENQNLSNLRDILLPKLMNGQIRLR